MTLWNSSRTIVHLFCFYYSYSQLLQNYAIFFLLGIIEIIESNSINRICFVLIVCLQKAFVLIIILLDAKSNHFYNLTDNLFIYKNND